MHVYDVLKRLKDHQHIEDRLMIEEDTMIKSLMKHCIKFAKTKNALKAELKKRSEYRRRLVAAERKNKNLKILLEKQKQRNAEVAELEANGVNYRQIFKEGRFRKCFKKESTNIFINPKALPIAAQGMCVFLNEENKSNWRPFNIPIDNLNMSDVPLEFWTQTQFQNKNQQQWDALIIG